MSGPRLSICYALPGQDLIPGSSRTRHVLSLARALARSAQVTVVFVRVLGDVEEGLAAAAAVGDDRVQRMSGQAVHPEAFTHGTSEQRTSWFRRGFVSGRPEDCDTFNS